MEVTCDKGLLPETNCRVCAYVACILTSEATWVGYALLVLMSSWDLLTNTKLYSITSLIL